MTREEVRVELKQYSTDHPKLFRVPWTIREEDNRRRAELELDANGEARQVSEVPEKPSPKWAEVTRTRTRSGTCPARICRYLAVPASLLSC